MRFLVCYALALLLAILGSFAVVLGGLVEWTSRRDPRVVAANDRVYRRLRATIATLADVAEGRLR